MLLTCLDIVVSVVASALQLDIIVVHTGEHLRTYFTDITMCDLPCCYRQATYVVGYSCVKERAVSVDL